LQVVISASGKHTATLIFLHGLGDTGHGWASSLADIRPPHLKIVCPTAPTRPVTLNSGFEMPAWFDLMSLDPKGQEDEEGIKKSFHRVESLIKAEIGAGVAPENIVLGGFSQGGALALYTGLKLKKEKVGGLLALSCWLPLHRQFDTGSGNLSAASAAASAGSKASGDYPPILQCHGDCDPIVPHKWGQLTSMLLKALVAEHEFKTYRGLQHSSSPEEMDDCKKFLMKITSQ